MQAWLRHYVTSWVTQELTELPLTANEESNSGLVRKMSMLKIGQVIVLLICITASQGRAESEGWIDHQAWSERWGVSHDSYIVKYFSESSVRSSFKEGGQGYTAEGLAVIFPEATMAEVSSALQHLAPELAIRATEIKSDVSLDRAWYDSGLETDMARRDHDGWRSSLGELGVRLHPLRAMRLNTRRYHAVANRNGYSVGTFLLFDGSDLFGSPCALLIVYRTDRAREWGWKSIHNPFSFGYEARTIDIVTNQEVALVDKLRRLLKRDAVVLPFPYARAWFTEQDLWRDLKSACLKMHR